MKKSFCMLSAAILLSAFSFSVDAYTLRLQWVPQAQFAGYYMAREKGYYQQERLEIEILPSGIGTTSLKELIAQRADFATGWMLAGLQLQAGGEDIKLIGQMSQKSALMLIAKKSSGIAKPEDFAGHTLGVWEGEFQVPPKALIRKYGIRNIKVVQQGFSVEPFINGELDIISAMGYNEYFQVLEAGVKREDLVIFDFVKLGLNLPEDGIFVRGEFYRNNPTVCERFIRASLKGWDYAFAHRAETVSYITEIANQTEYRTTPEKQRWMLDVMKSLMNGHNIRLSPEDFNRAANILMDLKMISQKPKYEDFYVMIIP